MMRDHIHALKKIPQMFDFSSGEKQVSPDKQILKT